MSPEIRALILRLKALGWDVDRIARSLMLTKFDVRKVIA